MSETNGELMVRIAVGAHLGDVRVMKERFAKLIDDLQPYRDDGGETGRCAQIAMNKLEEACMFAVKAMTYVRPSARCEHINTGIRRNLNTGQEVVYCELCSTVLGPAQSP